MSGVSGCAAASTTFSASSMAPRPPSPKTLAVAQGTPRLCAVSVDDRQLLGRVGDELVDGHDRRLAEMRGAVEVGGQVVEPALDGPRVRLLGLRRAATPPCILRARIVATITTAAGLRPAERHFRSKNFSPPRSNANPASVTA